MSISTSHKYDTVQYPMALAAGRDSPFGAVGTAVLLRWLTDGVDDIPDSDPVDSTIMALRHLGVWEDWFTADSRSKDYASNLVQAKQCLLRMLPPLGTELVIRESSNRLMHGFAVGTKVTRVAGGPLIEVATGRGYFDSTGATFVVSGRLTDTSTRDLEQTVDTADVEPWWTNEPVVSAAMMRAYAMERVREALEIIGDIYNDEADRRGWCSEADAITTKVNRSLSLAGLPSDVMGGRTADVTVELTVPLTVYVTREYTVTVPRSWVDDSAILYSAVERVYTDDPLSARNWLNDYEIKNAEFSDDAKFDSDTINII